MRSIRNGLLLLTLAAPLIAGCQSKTEDVPPPSPAPTGTNLQPTNMGGGGAAPTSSTTIPPPPGWKPPGK